MAPFTQGLARAEWRRNSDGARLVAAEQLPTFEVLADLWTPAGYTLTAFQAEVVL